MFSGCNTSILLWGCTVGAPPHQVHDGIILASKATKGNPPQKETDVCMPWRGTYSLCYLLHHLPVHHLHHQIHTHAFYIFKEDSVRSRLSPHEFKYTAECVATDVQLSLFFHSMSLPHRLI